MKEFKPLLGILQVNESKVVLINTTVLQLRMCCRYLGLCYLRSKSILSKKFSLKQPKLYFLYVFITWNMCILMAFFNKNGLTRSLTVNIYNTERALAQFVMLEKV